MHSPSFLHCLSFFATTIAVSFSPDGAQLQGFKCEYPSLTGWIPCNNQNNRQCWLMKGDGQPFHAQSAFDIHTKYEEISPPGVQREYWLTLSEFNEFAPDGYRKDRAKLFNGTYPGPLIEACWGDRIVVHITNDLPDNGTTVHWHGIRQNGSPEMDGVNGVTQCPIALGDTFTYNFTASQYGHSWYHSHYSLQLADGAAGPLVIHGPDSANWDEAFTVTIGSWVHATAFSQFYRQLLGLAVVDHLPEAQSILLNGRGHFACNQSDPGSSESSDVDCVGVGSFFEKTFERGKRYLLRLINGSFDSSFTFSIDQHRLEVISNDFVPIHPYNATSVMLGSGQRYGIVVEALADPDTDSGLDSNSAFWMRTEPALGCSSFEDPSSLINTTGIIRYGQAGGEGVEPTTTSWSYSNICHDEPYESLTPIVPWTVGQTPLNNKTEDTFVAGNYEGAEFHGSTVRWEMTNNPMWLNFSDPTIMNLENTTWNPEYAVVDYHDIEDDYDSTKGWVYLIVSDRFPIQSSDSKRSAYKRITPAAHPMHLHGHDFAIIGQSSDRYDEALAPQSWKFDNPPRRDTVLLPANGYVALAFKPDNPGIWLLHCHIAWHSSSGMALQITERQSDISNIISLDQTQRGCESWQHWDLQFIQDDSGV